MWKTDQRVQNIEKGKGNRKKLDLKVSFAHYIRKSSIMVKFELELTYTYYIDLCNKHGLHDDLIEPCFTWSIIQTVKIDNKIIFY